MDRRLFLKSGLASLGYVASHQLMAQSLGLLSSISLQSGTAPTDYKTLVLVYLTGGLDSLGLIIPTNASEFNEYQKLRQHLAFTDSNLIDFGVSGYKVPSACQSMANLYQANKLAWVSNVGPLRQPTTKDMIQRNERAMPLFVGSHNSQMILWQSGTMNPNANEGWGARMIELMNLNATAITPNISLDGSQLFTTTLNMQTFTVNRSGISNISRIDGGEDQTLFYALNNLPRNNVLDLELGKRNVNTLENSAYLKSVVDNIPEASVAYPGVSSWADDEIQQQLKMAARLIEAAPTLGQHRQVLMVQMHGYDTHDNQDRDLPALIQGLFSNLEAFQADLEQRGVDDRVVTFNQSDFGRTPTINANGTDHGWGGHYFMMGTPVNGGQIVGQIPEFGLETNKMLYNLTIPDYSVEQYASNLAKWFGLSAGEILDVFPTLSNFDDIDFGLLNS